jgi:hypothetical protein
MMVEHDISLAKLYEDLRATVRKKDPSQVLGPAEESMFYLGAMAAIRVLTAGVTKKEVAAEISANRAATKATLKAQGKWPPGE